VTVNSGAKVTDSVVFERVVVGANAVVQRAILDKDVVVDAGAAIGVDPDVDRARGFTVTDTGITVVGKGVHVPA
jgi:glucose-1-phosphate adenylyltransferase